MSLESIRPSIQQEIESVQAQLEKQTKEAAALCLQHAEANERREQLKRFLRTLTSFAAALAQMEPQEAPLAVPVEEDNAADNSTRLGRTTASDRYSSRSERTS